MQSDPIIVEQARELFLKTDFTKKEIAALLNVNRKTIGLWAQQGRWQEMKYVEANTQVAVQKDLYAQLTALNKRISRRSSSPYPSVEESAVQRRLIISVNSFNFQPVNNYMQIIKQFIKDLANINADLSYQVEGYLEYIYADRIDKIRSGADALQMPVDEDEDDLDQETGTDLENPAIIDGDGVFEGANVSPAVEWEVKKNYINQQ